MGLGERLTYHGQVDGTLVELRLRRLYAEAILLVARHRSAIVDLAKIAIGRRVLGRRVLEDFAKDHQLGGAPR